jgi:hypothetical protein
MREGYEDLYREREEQLVGHAARREFRELDGEIRSHRRRVDELDEKELRDRNGVYLSRVLDRWVLEGDLDGLSGEIGKAALDAATDAAGEGDDRTPAQRRADGLVRIWRRFLDLEDLPIEAGEAPHLSLTISWETIQSWLPCPTAPAVLAGALSKHEVNRLLCDVNVARIILGPDGQPLDVGREHRTAPRWLRRAVAKRDGGCRYPGCTRLPNRCEAHQRRPPQSLDEPLRRHHLHRPRPTRHQNRMNATRLQGSRRQSDVLQARFTRERIVVGRQAVEVVNAVRSRRAEWCRGI